MKTTKAKTYLIIATMLPIILIAYLAISVYISSFGKLTEYSFIYAHCDSDISDRFCCPVSYIEKNVNYDAKKEENLSKRLDACDKQKYIDSDDLKFFTYDVRDNTTNPITVKEIRQFNLSLNKLSPDGAYFDRYNTIQNLGNVGIVHLTSGLFNTLRREEEIYKLNIPINNNSMSSFVAWIIVE